MKQVILPIILCVALIFSSGCSIFSSSGKAAKKEAEGRTRIENVETQQAVNNVDKLDAIANLSYGVNRALNKINDPPLEVVVAKDVNTRVMSITGSPTLAKMKDMEEMIDQLTSKLATERDLGLKRLNAKDSEIIDLQDQAKELATAKNAEIRKYMIAAQEAAAASDAYKAELNKMDKWFGLGAVWYGLKKFVISMAWILGIGGILFLVLRIAAGSNPVCGAIFGIIEQMVAWVINVVKVIFPKALSFAGHVSEGVYNAYKSTLTKLVDSVQVVKDRAKAAGKTPNLEEVLDEVAKSMNADEKAIVDEIKKALNWK